MSVLTVVRGPGKGSSIALSEAQSYTIGAGREASLRIGGEQIADAHLVVKALKGGGFGAKGLAGPFRHNGKSVAAARLGDGDQLAVGDSVLEFHELAPHERDWPAEIGGFRVLGVLGSGGMGTVFRAEQVSLGREVALKVLSRERTADAMFVGRFVAEARAAARLNHPNVVQVFDVDHIDDAYFYSMDLMHGGSVEELLKRRGRLPADEAARIVRQAALALGFAERMNIVHRDIKPDNLMIDRHGHVKVADLGLALTEDDEHGQVAGTPHFMSPEQARREKLDHRSDLYSLGCTFFRLVTGRTPFSGNSVREILTAQVKQEPERADAVNPEVPPKIADVIDQLLQKDPDDRFESAEELVAAIDEATTPPARTGRWLMIVAVFALLAVAAAVFWPREAPNNSEPPTVYVTNPGDVETAAANRRLAAENAYLQARARRLQGEDLAAALEAMAAAHPDTEAATKASAEAEALRERIRSEAEAEARHRAAVATAAQRLREQFQQELQAGDLPAAATTLEAGSVSEELRQAPEVQVVAEELAIELERAAAAHIAKLDDAVVEAIEAQNPALARQRLAPLQALAAKDGGWPERLIADRAILTARIDTRLGAIHELDRVRQAEADKVAWQRAMTTTLAADGPLARLRELRPGETAKAYARLAADAEGRDAAIACAALAAALAQAQDYLDALRALAGKQGIEFTLPDGDPGLVFGAGDDPTRPGLEVRELKGERRVAGWEELRQAPGLWLPAIEGKDQARAALVSCLVWTAHLDEARRYLRALDPDNPDSGTGASGYALPLFDLPLLESALGGSGDDWTFFLRRELAALHQVARSLHALSDHRNQAAAALVERASRDYADSLTIRVLQ